MKRVGRAVDRAVGVLSGACAAISALLLVLMMLLIVVQVSVRQLGGSNLNLAVEMSGYAIAGITLLAAPYGLRSGAFIRVSLVYDRLAPVGRALLQLVFDCLGILYVGLLTYYLWEVAGDFQRGSVVSSTGTGTPLYLPLFVVVFGAAVCCLALAVEIVRDVLAAAAGTTGRAIRDRSVPAAPRSGL